MVQDHKIYFAGCGDLFFVGNEMALGNISFNVCYCHRCALLGEIQTNGWTKSYGLWDYEKNKPRNL